MPGTMRILVRRETEEGERPLSKSISCVAAYTLGHALEKDGRIDAGRPLS